MSFDYARAWREVASPAYTALPQNLRDLYIRVGEECSEFSQERPTLDLPWPDADMSDLRSVFAKVPAEFLAEAAHIIYFYGHWAPAGTNVGNLRTPGTVRFEGAASTVDVSPSNFGNGAHWRFSNYADQDLRRRLNLSRDPAPSSSSFNVHQGFLRACWSDWDQWQWEEIGLGTMDTYMRATNICRPSLIRVQGRQQIKDQADLHRWFNELKEACLPKGGGFLPKFFDLSEYGG